jgi:hypothetical protein
MTEIENCIRLPENNWLWLLSMLLVARPHMFESMLGLIGDVFLTNGRTSAGHLFYLLSRNPESILNQIRIIGIPDVQIAYSLVNVKNYTLLRLSEIFELCVVLSQSPKETDSRKKVSGSKWLQIAKAKHAEFLFDIGLVDLSIAYCHALIDLLNGPNPDTITIKTIRRLNDLNELTSEIM